MPRPAIPRGQLGTVNVRELPPTIDGNGRKVRKFEARGRYRDRAGAYTQVQRQGASARKAEQNLRAAVTMEQIGAGGVLGAESTIADASNIWFAKYRRLVDRGIRSGTTMDRYRYLANSIILPSLGHVKLYECTPGRLGMFFEALAERTTRTGRPFSANHRRNVRVVLSGILQTGVTHDALPRNPVKELDDIESDRRADPPRALTPNERRAFFAWFYATDGDEATSRARVVARRRELPEFLLLMVGTGLRIGEVCGLRWRDVELDGPSIMRNGVFEPQPLLAVTGNVVRINGRGLVRNVGKTEKALRIVPLPRFVADMLRARKPADADPDWPVFPSAYFRSGSAFWRSPEKTAAHIADVRKAMGIPWKLTSHTFRKTAATIWHDMLTPRQAADLIGHSKISTLTDVYVGRGELHAEGAAVMDAAWTEHERESE